MSLRSVRVLLIGLITYFWLIIVLLTILNLHKIVLLILPQHIYLRFLIAFYSLSELSGCQELKYQAGNKLQSLVTSAHSSFCLLFMLYDLFLMRSFDQADLLLSLVSFLKNSNKHFRFTVKRCAFPSHTQSQETSQNQSLLLNLLC